MFDLAVLGAFVGVVIILFLVPGPAVMVVLTRTAQAGRRAGLLTGLGVALGDLIHSLFAAAGLSAVLMTSALAFDLVKYIGAAYLLYLGIRAMMEKNPEARSSDRSAAPASSGKVFFQGVLIEVLNPKTALFFLAFLPQFVHPERGGVFLQITILGLIFVLMSVIYTSLLVFLSQPIGRLLARFSFLKRRQGKIIGSVFIALGLKVALQEH